MTQINTPVNPNIPDAYVIVVTPQVALAPGVATDRLAVVGTAPWGPVNAPIALGVHDITRIFGGVVNRSHDLGTALAVGGLAGAENLMGVRVTDGTDVAATIGALGNATGLTVTSKYSGTTANGDTVTLGAGTAASSFKITVTRAGQPPEVFDNITGSGNAFYVNAAAAINNGQSGLRGPSQLITATAGASTGAPTAGTVTLAGGSDGVASITTSVLIGVDTGTRTGMYALRGTGPGVLNIADLTDYTSHPAQTAFCLAEGYYGVTAGPAGEYTNLATVVTNLQTQGTNTYALKVMVGDFCYFLDTNNGVTRNVSPASFLAGELVTLLPFQSSLNKAITGVVGTQKSYAGQQYSEADLGVIGGGCLDLIANPIPAGAAFGGRFGRNSSSNAAIWGDNYSRMIPYLAYSLAQTIGQFVGQIQTEAQRLAAIATVDAFLNGLATATPVPWISNPQGTQPYSVVCDNTNNSPAQVALGYEVMDVRVQLGPVIMQFVLNLQAGQNVTVQPASSL